MLLFKNYVAININPYFNIFGLKLMDTGSMTKSSNPFRKGDNTFTYKLFCNIV